MLDVLVLNAGVAQPPVPLAHLDSRAAHAVVDTNLLGTFTLAVSTMLYLAMWYASAPFWAWARAVLISSIG